MVPSCTLSAFLFVLRRHGFVTYGHAMHEGYSICDHQGVGCDDNSAQCLFVTFLIDICERLSYYPGD